MTTIDSLLVLVETYCAATRLAEATVSARVMNDGKRLKAIRAGKDIGARRLAEAVQWFSDHWPEDAEWPLSVARPMPRARVTEEAPA